MNKPEQYLLVAEAFSRQSAHYDIDDQSNQILRIMRRQVRSEVERIIKPPAHILELNAGTGLDALYFAEKGYEVTATDLSPGMIEQIEKKIKDHNLQDRLNALQAGFHELSEKVTGKFDFVFSNMGGLNCEKDLSVVFEQLTRLIRPNANTLLVVMPTHCPWEWASVLKGKWKQAFRRYRKNGAKAHLEGIHFKTFYHDLSDIKKFMPNEWELINSTGLGVTLPQPQSSVIPDRYPLTFKVLKSIDQKVRKLYPFNRCGDHIIIELRYHPA